MAEPQKPEDADAAHKAQAAREAARRIKAKAEADFHAAFDSAPTKTNLVKALTAASGVLESIAALGRYSTFKAYDAAFTTANDHKRYAKDEITQRLTRRSEYLHLADVAAL